jgi:hypothetical protein
VTPEEAQEAAEHKAAALHNVGWETGAGATIWARVIDDTLALHESARGRFGENAANLEAWERLHGTAFTLIVAIEQVLAFERRVRKLTGDGDLANARTHFDAVWPDTKRLRDLVAHLDAYAVGEGLRQIGKQSPPIPPISDKYLWALIYWGNGGGTIVNLGGEQLDLRAAAEAAKELAKVVERVRVKHLKQAEQDANAAMRQRFGLRAE